MTYERNRGHLGSYGAVVFTIVLSLFLIPVSSNKYQTDNTKYQLLDFSTYYTASHDSTYIENISVNETNWVWHVWNENNNYYIDPGGIQLTNHYLDYWTHNIWCIWINTSQDYQRRCSDSMNWNWVNTTDGYSWVELNGTATYSEGSYSAIFRIRYYLVDGYDRINISLGIKNTGQDITYMYFGWLVKDIKIGGDEINDIGVGLDLENNTHEYNLSKNLALEFDKTQSQRQYTLKDNITNKSVELWWDSKSWKDNNQYNDTNFRLNLTHSLFPNQYNTPVMLLIHIGSLNNGQIAYTNFWWNDPPIFYYDCMPDLCGYYFGTLSNCPAENFYCSAGTRCTAFGCSLTAVSCASNYCNICGDCDGSGSCDTMSCGIHGSCIGGKVCDGQGKGSGNCVNKVGLGSTCYCDAMCSEGACIDNVCTEHYLEVNLTQPAPSVYDDSNPYDIEQNDTFWINATIECKVTTCGDVYGTARYNVSTNPDTVINITEGATPLYVVNPRLKWKGNFTGDNDEQNSAIYVDGVIYINSRAQEKIFAINSTDGTEIWNFDATGGDSWGGPTYYEGNIYDAFTRVWAINATDGIEIWNYTELGKNFSQNVAIDDDYVIAVTFTTAYVVALNRADGTHIWNVTAPSQYLNSITSEPLLFNDYVIVAYHSTQNVPTLYAFNVTDGTQIWNHTNTGDGYYDSSPILYNDTIYIGGYDGDFWAINLTGDTVWSYDMIMASTLSTPSAHDGRVFLGAVEGPGNIILQAFDSSSGENLWNFSSVGTPDTDYVYNQPSITSTGLIFFGTEGSNDGYMYAVNETDGTLIWSYHDDDVVGYTIIANGDVFVITDSWYLYAFDFGDGGGNWTMLGYDSNRTGYTPVGLTNYIEDNKKTCDSMDVGDTCELKWEVNATGTIGSIHKVGVLFTSSSNHTDNATINITSPVPPVVVSMVLSRALADGVMFGTVKGNTIGNPALNNSNQENTKYNVTVGPTSSVNVDFYSKLNESFPSGVYGNESSSTTSSSSGFTINTTFTNSWTILGNLTQNCTDLGAGGNCWIRFYLDTVSVTDTYIERNYTICGVQTGLDSSTCG